MATNQETQTLDETLNKTDLGHVINEHRKTVMIVGAFLVAAVIVYAVIDQISKQNKIEKLDRLFTVEQTVFKPYLDQKEGGADTFISALTGINNELVAEPNLIPPLMEALNKLSEQNQINDTVLSTTQKWLDSMNPNNFLHTMLAIRLAALYEDAGKIDQATRNLELLVANKRDILKDKIHYELGRMYLAAGDRETAKERFEYLFKNHENTEYAKNAKVLLSDL